MMTPGSGNLDVPFRGPAVTPAEPRRRHERNASLGRPLRRTRPLADRFWPKVDSSGECWMWLGARHRNPSGDYGHIRNEAGRNVKAHRVAWEMENGAVPDGLILDHLCRTRLCVRPSHLELVTGRENTLRGESFSAVNARMTACRRGHPLTQDNLRPRHDGRRECWTCHRERAA